MLPHLINYSIKPAGHPTALAIGKCKQQLWNGWHFSTRGSGNNLIDWKNYHSSNIGLAIGTSLTVKSIIDSGSILFFA
ncbi:uncharacterized protein METZ01_LOCUS101884 [marine metagenome]|uniref:Uncharacterized protein n=1 Tax=marine metagenome TaxID=408172 RepID=A0A381W913_9ZZZZ